MNSAASVRPPAVAGAFYPGDAGELDGAVRGLLAAAQLIDDGPAPKAIIAPHAGYVYSGAVAAEAYARLAKVRDTISRVVLVGPAHRMPFHGIAASGASAFATPLGNVPVDAEATRQLMALHHVVVLNEAHQLEHSLEVHLPFLQRTLGDFKLVPLVVGNATGAQVAEALEMLWGGPETLIVISSDLSHQLDYEAARTSDAAVCKAIENYQPDHIDGPQACGGIPIKGLLKIARARSMEVATLDLRNSGDTAGPRDHVVGYGAWIFRETMAPDAKPEVDPAPKAADSADAAADIIARHGPALLRIAMSSMAYGMASSKPMEINPALYPAGMGETVASFVTLHLAGKLRGCIGSPLAVKPLAVDVADNAFSAAFKDPRFKPITISELAQVEFDVSVLSPPTPIAFASEAELIAGLRPHRDGLIIKLGERRALFLPSVWESLPARADFLAQLKKKAGIDANQSTAGLSASRFTAASMAYSELGKN
ncbi:MAG: AmmeMemoRadiSam system protein B [Alphaproteobacteria bacterium]